MEESVDHMGQQRDGEEAKTCLRSRLVGLELRDVEVLDEICGYQYAAEAVSGMAWRTSCES